MDALVSYVRRIIPPTETHFIVPVIVFPLAGASIDLWFTASRYYDSSAGGEGQIITDYLSCSRASIGYAKTSAGTLTQFASNELRITDLGLLVEDARENLVSYSETFQTSPWSPDEASITTNQTTAPNGNNVGARLEEGTSTGSRQMRYLGVGGPSAATYTASCYFKEGTRRYCALEFAHDAASPVRHTIVVDLQTGSVTSTDTTGSGSPSSSVESMGNGWYRLCITQTYEAIPGSMYIMVSVSDSATPSFSNGVPAYTGGGSSQYVYVWGAQVELGAFASSYIPTTASTVTRAADTVTSIGGLNTIFSNLPQSAVVDLIIYQGSVSFSRIIGNSTDTDSIIQIQNADNFFAMAAGANGLIGTSGTAGAFTTGMKVGACQDNNGRSLVGAGQTVISDAFSVAIANAKIGSSGGLHPNTFGYFRRITAWTSRLADATLQGLTSP